MLSALRTERHKNYQFGFTIHEGNKEVKVAIIDALGMCE